MGSFGRKFKREKLRREFDKFGKQWSSAKEFQKMRIDEGEQLQEGEPVLGRKPSFGQFLKRLREVEVEKDREEQLRNEQLLTSEKDVDLEWEE